MSRLLKSVKTISPFKAGLIALIVLVVFVYLGFTKFANPFANPYTIHAIVPNANGLRPQSQVRIAGVNVGTVTSVAPASSCRLGASTALQTQCSAADVTMTINGTGLPIHKDATFWIRPRIFLEGNFFVDLSPGSPEAPVAPDGFVFPIQQTRVPVQFGQVLTSLQTDTRTNLQILLQQYGLAVTTGGTAYNQSIAYWTPAYKWGAAVSHDALGEQPHDLSGWIDKAGVVNGALSAHPQNLKNLVTYLDTTALAFAREQGALSNAVAELPTTLRVAIPALNAVQTAICSGPQGPGCAPGPLRQFTRALIPGVQSTAPMIDASLPFYKQVRLLVSPPELQGLANDLSFTVPALAKLNALSVPFMKNEVRPASSCQVHVILPWSNLTIQDPHFNASNGFPARPVYVEGVDYLPGLAGESRNFDANGPYVRILGTGGSVTYSMSPGLFGTALNSIQGAQPQTPAPHPSGDGSAVNVSRPPLRETVPCETQPAISQSEINDAPTAAGPTPVSLGGLPGLPGVPGVPGLPGVPPAGVALQRSSALLETGLLESQAKRQGLRIRMARSAAKTHAMARPRLRRRRNRP